MNGLIRLPGAEAGAAEADGLIGCSIGEPPPSAARGDGFCKAFLSTRDIALPC